MKDPPGVQVAFQICGHPPLISEGVLTDIFPLGKATIAAALPRTSRLRLNAGALDAATPLTGAYLVPHLTTAAPQSRLDALDEGFFPRLHPSGTSCPSLSRGGEGGIEPTGSLPGKNPTPQLSWILRFGGGANSCSLWGGDLPTPNTQGYASFSRLYKERTTHAASASPADSYLCHPPTDIKTPPDPLPSGPTPPTAAAVPPSSGLPTSRSGTVRPVGRRTALPTPSSLGQWPHCLYSRL